MSILSKARHDYLNHRADTDVIKTSFPNNLCFTLDGVILCEKAFVNILGMANSRGEKHTTWRNCLKEFLSCECVKIRV